jgi:hypothetical protein
MALIEKKTGFRFLDLPIELVENLLVYIPFVELTRIRTTSKLFNRGLCLAIIKKYKTAFRSGSEEKRIIMSILIDKPMFLNRGPGSTSHLRYIGSESLNQMIVMIYYKNKPYYVLRYNFTRIPKNPLRFLRKAIPVFSKKY